MQIHYCYTCNKRVEGDDTVTLDGKVYCKPCADQVPESEYLSKSDGTQSARATPAHGMRRTPGTARPTTRSPARGVQSTAPARSSKSGMRPASPAHGTPTRSSPRGSGGHAIPNLRKSGGEASVAPQSESSPESGAAPVQRTTPESRKIRSSGNSSTVIWVLVGIALLLAAVGAAMVVSGGPAQPGPPPPKKSELK